MISVDQALHIIIREVAPETIVKKKVVECFGYVLAEDVISKINMPPFRQSSMDGYAIKLSAENSYKIVGESKAGNTEINPHYSSSKEFGYAYAFNHYKF